MEKRLLVLGAGRHQKNLIKRAEKRNVRVVVSDYLSDSPGKQFASYPTNIDALDIDANIELGKKYCISGVITIGMDMAVVTMAEVANALGLPCYLSPESARISTNKILMKKAFAQEGVPIAPYCEAGNRLDEAMDVIQNLSFPCVVKPVDSQGQRGVQKVMELSDFEPAFCEALKESRSKKAIVEEYINGYEITVNGWVAGEKPQILMITDRVTYNPLPYIGIAFQHIYPSLHARSVGGKIRDIVHRIARAYGIERGPLYIQMIVGDNKIYVVEATCRVGGGHEESLFPIVTGTDVVERLIDLALEGKSERIDYEYDETEVQFHALVNFMLASPGVISVAKISESLVQQSMTEEGEFYYPRGHRISNLTNSLARVGYFIAKGSTREQLLQRAKVIYESLELIGEEGKNLLFWPPDEMMIG